MTVESLILYPLSIPAYFKSYIFSGSMRRTSGRLGACLDPVLEVVVEPVRFSQAADNAAYVAPYDSATSDSAPKTFFARFAKPSPFPFCLSNSRRPSWFLSSS